MEVSSSVLRPGPFPVGSRECIEALDGGQGSFRSPHPARFRRCWTSIPDDAIASGGREVALFHRFNERARDTLDRAAKKAKELRHAIVEPEHILASLAEASGETSFHSLLKSFDVPSAAVADSLEAVPGPAHGAQPPKEPIFSPEAKRVLEFAVDEADK